METLGKLASMKGETLVWGWHRDRYGIHEERWVSADGLPTKLVRDGGYESYDPPPNGETSDALPNWESHESPPNWMVRNTA